MTCTVAPTIAKVDIAPIGCGAAKMHGGEATTISKGVVADVGDARRDGYAADFITTLEGAARDSDHALGDDQLGDKNVVQIQLPRKIEGVGVVIGPKINPAPSGNIDDIDPLQAGAVGEGLCTDGLYARADGNIIQPSTFIKRTVAS